MEKQKNMQQAKTANLGPAALRTTAAAPPANIWVLRQIWVLRRSESEHHHLCSVGKFGSSI
jgi:hypothetical protein